MRGALASGCLLLALAVPVAAKDMTPQGMLVIAKYAGYCGALSGMLTFQDATKMPGGHEFLERYMRTESARLNMPVEQMVAQCKLAIKTYDELMLVMEADKPR